MQNSVPVLAIPIVDTSASMYQSNYVAITVIDTKAFISNMLPGDYLGVASYDTSGRVTYNLTLVDQALTVNENAANAVQNLSFNGGSTNMGAGLRTAVGMLSTAPANVSTGFILLSDGYQNGGIYPIPLPAGTPAVYSCAMGPNSDQNLMQQIATQSKGQYFYAPYVYIMMTIYNQIRAKTPNSQLVANGYKNASPYDSMLIPATISEGNDLAQFSVVWNDTSVVYVNTQPGLNQMSVTLVTPAGVVINPQPTLQGGAYVVFNIPNPAIGLWYIQIMYGGNKPQGLTGGAFEYVPPGTTATVTLDIDVPDVVKAGQPITFTARLADNGEVITGQHIQATITKPKISTRNALKIYASLYKDVQLPESVADVDKQSDIAKLDVVYKQNLPTIDLQPHIKFFQIIRQGNDNQYTGTITDTLEAGSYNIELQVNGYSAISGTTFSRTKLVSILVQD